MEQVIIQIRNLPADIGILWFDRNDVKPRRYWNDVEIEKLLGYIKEQVTGKKDVDLMVEGHLPILLASKLSVFCRDNKLKFAFCLPGQLENRVI